VSAQIERDHMETPTAEHARDVLSGAPGLATAMGQEHRVSCAGSSYRCRQDLIGMTGKNNHLILHCANIL